MISVKTHQILGTSSHSEYLQPSTPSSPVDAKKSPLALLAATCSNIGKPDPMPNSKPTLTVSPEKIDQKSDSVVDDKSSFKPYKQFDKGSRSPVDFTHGCGDAPKMKNSAISDSQMNAGKFDISGLTHGGVHYPVNDIAAVNGHLHSLHNRISLSCGANGMFVEVNHESLPKIGVSLPSSTTSLPANPASAAITPISPCKGQSMLSTLPLAAALPHGAIPATPCGCMQPLLGHHTAALPLDLRSNPVAINGSKPPSSPTSLTNTPYAAYATVKTATGATALVPICRDPYCMNCQNAIRLASASPINNNNGCTQCGHSTPSFGLNGILPLSLAPFASLPHPAVVTQSGPSPTDNALTPPSHLYSSNPSSNNNTVDAKISTYVCNWVSGGSSCGKRFPSSEDLLQHLRSHTITANVESPVTSVPIPLTNCHAGHHITLADSLKSKYPSTLSSINSARYHPYKTSFASGAPITALPLPAPGAYLPYPPTPYVLYDMGQRV